MKFSFEETVDKIPKSEKMFLGMRLKITAVATAFVAIVLTVVSSLFVFSEYSSTLADVNEQMMAAQDEAWAVLTGQEGDTDSEQSFGKDSKFSQTVPVIVYIYPNGKDRLEPVIVDAATLSNEVIDDFSERINSIGRGFSRDDAGGLYYLALDSPEGIIVAFTLQSIVDSRVEGYARAFSSLVVTVSFLFLVVAWFISSWIVRPVRDAWSKQKQFIADASHELKNPVSIIVTNSSLLLDKTNDEETRKWTSSTLAEAEGLTSLINDMLFLATNEDEKVHDPEVVNLSREAARIAMQFESRAYEKHISIDYDNIESDILLLCDKQAIKRLVTILLDNACKYADPDTVIVVKVKSERRSAVLEVKSVGPEIDSEQLMHLFDRFFRMDESRHRGQGYGLGLAMAKSIVESHDGNIKAEADGKETTFIVNLPRYHESAKTLEQAQ